MKVFLRNIKLVLSEHPKMTFFFTWLLLVLIVALVFYFRYPYAYLDPNFYAEDGTIFVKNILTNGPLSATFSLFNGYFVVGQYLLADISVGLSYLLGHGFVTIPKAIAVVSYLFWGLICTLPFLLFRKQLGIVLSLLTVALLAIVPLGAYDYAAIGTIGNLKFAFFFVAALLIVYRNQGFSTNKWQQLGVDIALLLCVLTNVLVIVLLPFGLWRYRAEIRRGLRNIKQLPGIISAGLISLIVLGLISAIYVLIIYRLGIPKMPGYLDTPLKSNALINIFYRGSVYGLLFPINEIMNDIAAMILMVGFVVLAFISKYRFSLLFFGFAIIINVIGFVANRPGITDFFQTYRLDGGPGHFFYAGTMIFIFGCMYALQGRFNLAKRWAKIGFSVAVLLFVIVAVPYSGLRIVSYATIDGLRPTVGSEVNRVCHASDTSGTASINVYPSEGWVLKLPYLSICVR